MSVSVGNNNSTTASYLTRESDHTNDPSSSSLEILGRASAWIADAVDNSSVIKWVRRFGGDTPVNTVPVEQKPLVDPASVLCFDEMVHVMRYLEATDLCFASTVSQKWQEAADCESVWKHRCISDFGNDATLQHRATLSGKLAWKRTYLAFDDALQLFNGDVDAGLRRLKSKCGVSEDQLPKFFANVRLGFAKGHMVGLFLGRFTHDRDRINGYPYITKFTSTMDFKGYSIHAALRTFLKRVHMTAERASARDRLLRCFCRQYLNCNEYQGKKLTEDQMFIIVCSILLMSIDLSSDIIINKMSKTSFTENTIYGLVSLDAQRAPPILDHSASEDEGTNNNTFTSDHSARSAAEWEALTWETLSAAYDDVKQNGHITQHMKRAA